MGLLGVLLAQVRLLLLGRQGLVLPRLDIVLVLPAHNHHLVLGQAVVLGGGRRVGRLLPVVGRELVLVLQEGVLVALGLVLLRGKGCPDRCHPVVGLAGGSVQLIDLLLLLVDLGTALGRGLLALALQRRRLLGLVLVLVVKDGL